MADSGSADCLTCEGTDSCYDCEGTGRCHADGHDELGSECHCGGFGECVVCDGTGICSECEGAEVERPRALPRSGLDINDPAFRVGPDGGLMREEGGVSDRVRVFIALELPAEAVREAARLAGAIAALGVDGVRATWPADLHLTVKYVGEVDRQTVTDLRDALQRTVMDAAPAELAFGDVGGFPSLESPEVIYLAVNSMDGGLPDLRAGLIDQLGGLDVPEDTFGFTPHVTLARLEGEARSASLRLVARITDENRPPSKRLRFMSNNLTLFRSVRSGSRTTRYESICRVSLGDSGEDVPR